MKTLEVKIAKYEPTESELLSDHRVASPFGASGTKWAHPKSVDKWLRKMAIGETLNVCCGDSMVGDISAPVQVRLKKAVWDRRLFALTGNGVFIRLYWVFDRKVKPLVSWDPSALGEVSDSEVES